MLATRLRLGLVSAATGLLLAACGATSNNGGTASSASSSPALINTASIKVGGKTETVLTNDKGLTLYFFTRDTPTTVACIGVCATTWPPVLLTTDSFRAAIPQPGALSVVNGPNGKQVLYNGHPLYTYSKDGPGDAHGQGIGGKWFVATPDLASAQASSDAGYSSY